MAKVNELEKQYENKKEKDRLDEDIKKTEERLVHAEVLTKGLADEQMRWKETVEYLNEIISKLLGDIFISGASICHYGPFTGVYRQELVDYWLEKCKEEEILCTEKYALGTSL